MCGIWGRITRDRTVKLEELVHPVRVLAHRGPDGYGVYCEGSAALAHTRLSIIDLEGGNQPLLSFDGQWIGVVNGELYDYIAIREKLEGEGVKFRTRSDSEVLLNLFARGGARALQGLSGEFAFIFYNPARGLFCYGRDVHGVKPLFRSQEAGALTLASEVKALDSRKPSLDETYVKRFLSRIVVPPRTAIAGAEHVLPGAVHTFHARTGEFETEYFERLPFPRPRVKKGVDAVESVTREFRAAVRRRLVADVEVGCYLSGGIDSALTAAFMVEAGARPRAFTVGFRDREFDESERAARIARHLGIPHETIQLTRQNFFSSLRRSIIAFENPVGNPHGAAKNLLAELAGSKVKVVLSGEGSDEFFGGYAYQRIAKLRAFERRHPRLSLGALAKFLEREQGLGMGHLDGSGRRYDLSSDWGGRVPALFARIPARRYGRLATGQDVEAIARASSAELRAFLEQDLGVPRERVSEFDVDLWLGIRTDLFHYILSNVGDRQEMSHSLEGRTPFLDPRLTATAASLDPRALIRGLNEKWVLRELARGKLPEEAVRQRKHPFFSPLTYLLDRTYAAEISDAIRTLPAETPWLPWDKLSAVLLRDPRSIRAPRLLGSWMSARLVFYSMAVLIRDLRTPQLASPRGYALPESAADLSDRRWRTPK